MKLLNKKRLLQQTKSVIENDLCKYKESLTQVRTLVTEHKFVQAIDLCDSVIEATRPKDGEESILSKLIVTRQVKERFEAIRNVRLVGHMQHTISELFKKQVSFDS